MNNEYKATIGLEIHAELKTATKMFCHSKNNSEEKEPNVNVCPICMGHPGTLPVINKEAVKHVLKLGVAVGGELADFAEFDRKNYFYPDIPKGYQISQYKFPLVKGGELASVKLERIHLEEDTARSTHKGTHSLLDFNRAGVPLMELVTEPVIKSPLEAVAFAKELQLLLQYLSASDANMEKGEMRVEANVSVSETSTLGTKVEVKNLNSFRAVERAIEYEVERQTKLLEEGKKVVQETRGWDENKGLTFSQRLKEESHDYRYFPDPDLPKLFISEIPEFKIVALKKELPELPWKKRERYLKEYELSPEITEILVEDKDKASFFEKFIKTAANKEEIKAGVNLITQKLPQDENKVIPIDPIKFASLTRFYVTGALSSTATVEVLTDMYKGNKADPQEIVQKNGLLQQSDEKILNEIIEKVITGNTAVVDEYKNGKASSLEFLVGQGMKESRGGANPNVLRELLKKHLG